MTLLATLDRLWEPKWDPIRHYQTVSEEVFSEVRVAPLLYQAAFLCTNRSVVPFVHKKWIILSGKDYAPSYAQLHRIGSAPWSATLACSVRV